MAQIVSKYFLRGVNLEMVGEHAETWVNAVCSVTVVCSGVLLFLDAKLAITCDLFCFNQVSIFLSKTMF